MILILDGTSWGVVVDEIVAVEDLEIIADRKQDPLVNRSSFIHNVMESDKREGLIFELNTSNLLTKLEELETTY